MMLTRSLRLARRALRRPPRYVLGRIRRELGRQARRPWDRARPRLLTDRALLRIAKRPSIDELWHHVASTAFFVKTSDRRSWVARFAESSPDGVRQIIAAADAVLRHEFDLLGSGPVALGARLPWHVDFKTGRRWPLKWCFDFDPNELDRPSDVKVPWELSRCQHFVTLGQAWWLTGDPRFAEEFVAEVDDWIDQNPYTYGINWACPMDVGLRAIGWIWGLHFMADAPACASTAFRSKFLRLLFLHGEFVAANDEIDEVNGNHYLVDGVNLVFLGLCFRGTAQGSRWLATGKQVVLSEMVRQTHEDGTGIEQSTAYHRLVLEAFLAAGLLLRHGGESVDEFFWHRLERMHEFVCAYTKPDGQAPLIGDADDGRIHKLGTQPIGDHRYLLSTGAVLFQRGDFKRAAGRFWDESFWLLGPEALDAFEALDDATCDVHNFATHSQAFPAGGFYVLRNRVAHVVFDCGEVGLKGLGGHGHNDILSFELSLCGQNVITDSGAYLYTASREWRNYFRSTACHNTLEVDDEELNRLVHPDELWRLRYDAVPVGVRWHADGEWRSIRAGHRGYERLSSPVAHVRTLLLHREQPRVVIADRVEGIGNHRLVWRFHLDPAIHAEIHGDAARLTTAHQTSWLTIVDTSGPITLRLEPGWLSPQYGSKLARTIVVAEARSELPIDCTWSVTNQPLHPADRIEFFAAAKERA